jgi:hypothetical protein
MCALLEYDAYVCTLCCREGKTVLLFSRHQLNTEGPKGLLLTLLDRRVKIGEQIAIDWNSNCNSDNIHKVEVTVFEEH